MERRNQLEKYRIYINGRFEDPSTGRWFGSFDPYTGESWALIPECAREDADRAVRAAHEAFREGPWPRMTTSQRGALMRRLGDLVAKVAFAGSDATGRVICEAAARGLKRVTMELGGKSPNVVFEDADLDAAVNGAIGGIFAATGQTGVAGSRLPLQDSIHDGFLERLLALARTAKMGNPIEMDTQVGPITTQPQYRKVLSYVDIAKSEGADLVLGGGFKER